MDLKLLLDDEDKRRAFVIASKCCIDANSFNWYDSKFLRLFEAAKRFLEAVLPERLEAFVSAFNVLRTDPDFEVRHLDRVFDDETFEAILETVHNLPYVALEHYESGSFGRSLLRRHPYFTELQSGLTAKVSDLVGEPVEPAYNFLSLYRGAGKCEPHLDQPLSKWTLDVCIEQSVKWPIFFSQVVDWPSGPPVSGPSIESLRSAPALKFDSVILEPNQGAIFSGSSQWHFREPVEGGRTDFCHLLFFHYLPEGTDALVDPRQWAAHFQIPELDILIAADDLVIRRKTGSVDEAAAGEGSLAVESLPQATA